MSASSVQRLRLWRQRQSMRLFFAIGCILLAHTWLTLMPALWESNISRNAAVWLTAWFVLAQMATLIGLLAWLGPLMCGRQADREKLRSFAAEASQGGVKVVERSGDDGSL